jgi:hypothetical protein
LEDLYKVLLGMESQPGREIAYRLEKFIKGSAAGIFNNQSNFVINNPLTVFNLRNLQEELRPVAMHVILDFVWTKVKKTLKKRILILDEGWYMMKYQDSASFVYSIAKRARKYYLGMTTATQDVEDFLKNEYGKAVLTNSSIQILLKQGTAEVDMIAETFYLSEGEKALLLTADVGEGLFFAGQNHVAMKVFAAPFEHELITSNPMEILARQKREENQAAQVKKEEAINTSGSNSSSSSPAAAPAYSAPAPAAPAPAYTPPAPGPGATPTGSSGIYGQSAQGPAPSAYTPPAASPAPPSPPPPVYGAPPIPTETSAPGQAVSPILPKP